MKKYKVIIKSGPNWRTFNDAMLGVSVGSVNWQGDKFASILDFSTQHFSTIRIDVSDTLHRHNYIAEGASAEDAMQQALAEGNEWLKKHQSIINAASIKPQIIRWGEWYNHPNFEAMLNAFQEAYKTSKKLNAAIHHDVNEFYRRRNRKPTELEAFHSINLIIEELAVMTLQARLSPCLKIYPGEELHSLKIVRAGKITEAPRGLENEQFAKVKLERRNPHTD